VSVTAAFLRTRQVCLFITGETLLTLATFSWKKIHAGQYALIAACSQVASHTRGSSKDFVFGSLVDSRKFSRLIFDESRIKVVNKYRVRRRYGACLTAACRYSGRVQCQQVRSRRNNLKWWLWLIVLLQ